MKQVIFAMCVALWCGALLDAQAQSSTTSQQTPQNTNPSNINNINPISRGIMQLTAPAESKKDALVLYQNGDYNGSIEQCEKEIGRDSGRIDAYVIMCWSMVKTKRYAEARKRAEAGLAISPFDLRLIEVYGEAKYYLGDNAGALEQFQKYAARSNENGARLGAAYYFMGEIYVRQSRFQHADIALSTAVKKEPLIDRWWSRLGYAREMAGNLREAINAYDEALRLNSALVDAVNGRKRVSQRL